MAPQIGQQQAIYHNSQQTQVAYTAELMQEAQQRPARYHSLNEQVALQQEAPPPHQQHANSISDSQFYTTTMLYLGAQAVSTCSPAAASHQATFYQPHPHAHHQPHHNLAGYSNQEHYYSHQAQPQVSSQQQQQQQQQQFATYAPASHHHQYAAGEFGAFEQQYANESAYAAQLDYYGQQAQQQQQQPPPPPSHYFIGQEEATSAAAAAAYQCQRTETSVTQAGKQAAPAATSVQLKPQNGATEQRNRQQQANNQKHSKKCKHVQKQTIINGTIVTIARRKNATRETTAMLKDWLDEHGRNPYPTKSEKIMLSIITKMSLTQVSTWFANARRRMKKENKAQWMGASNPLVGPTSNVQQQQQQHSYSSATSTTTQASNGLAVGGSPPACSSSSSSTSGIRYLIERHQKQQIRARLEASAEHRTSASTMTVNISSPSSLHLNSATRLARGIESPTSQSSPRSSTTM